jgi:hypothetical protein
VQGGAAGERSTGGNGDVGTQKAARRTVKDAHGADGFEDGNVEGLAKDDQSGAEGQVKRRDGAQIYSFGLAEDVPVHKCRSLEGCSEGGGMVDTGKKRVEPNVASMEKVGAECVIVPFKRYAIISKTSTECFLNFAIHISGMYQMKAYMMWGAANPNASNQLLTVRASMMSLEL